jgi:hypothetical protein
MGDGDVLAIIRSADLEVTDKVDGVMVTRNPTKDESLVGTASAVLPFDEHVTIIVRATQGNRLMDRALFLSEDVARFCPRHRTVSVVTDAGTLSEEWETLMEWRSKNFVGLEEAVENSGGEVWDGWRGIDRLMKEGRGVSLMPGVKEENQQHSEADCAYAQEAVVRHEMDLGVDGAPMQSAPWALTRREPS